MPIVVATASPGPWMTGMPAAIPSSPAGPARSGAALVAGATTSGTGIVPTATVRLKKKDAVFQEAACGDGPVDAAYRAMDKITGLRPELLDYALRSVSSGTDAQGDVVVKVSDKGLVVMGKGTSTDIVEASAKAYLNALNKILSARASGRAAAKKNEGM